MGMLYNDCGPYLEALMAYIDTFQALAIEYGIDHEKATRHSELCCAAIERLKDRIKEWDRDIG